MVAVEEERVIDKNKFRCMDRDKLSRLRAKVLNRARDLARSGQHTNHKSIIEQMEPLDVVARNGLQDIGFQLDRLCALARAERPRIERPGRSQPTTQLPR
jgi:hypothetical protein